MNHASIAREFAIFCLTVTLVFFPIFSESFDPGDLPREDQQGDREYLYLEDDYDFATAATTGSWELYDLSGYPRPALQQGGTHFIPSRGIPIIVDRHLFRPDEIDYWISRLDFLASPVEGATISPLESHLPNSPRNYRNGIHEGIDYYHGYSGVTINMGTPVLAAAPGIVTRIDHDYREPAKIERNRFLDLAREEEITPESVLDKLRGRQVWVEHTEEGALTRYAHLLEVCPGLQVGDRVEAGQYLGGIGNSGTSYGVQGTYGGAHLHFEVWLEGNYFGSGLSPREIRAILTGVLK